jgi:hypothetical protein
MDLIGKGKSYIQLDCGTVVGIGLPSFRSGFSRACAGRTSKPERTQCRGRNEQLHGQFELQRQLGYGDTTTRDDTTGPMTTSGK